MKKISYSFLKFTTKGTYFLRKKPVVMSSRLRIKSPNLQLLEEAFLGDFLALFLKQGSAVKVKCVKKSCSVCHSSHTR